MSDTYEIIAEIIKTKFTDKRLPSIEFNSNTKFSDIGLDSLDVMEIIIEVEGKVGKTIDNKKIKNIFTINDLHNLFENGD